MTDKSRNPHASCSILKLESETRLAIMLILTLGSHGRFRVTVTGQVQSGDELPSPTQGPFPPIPADLQIALAPKPMRVDPAVFALVDHLGALRHEIKRRYGVCGRVERTPSVCRSALCSPFLPPFGPGSVTVFDPALLCASPSQKPACGITAQASSYRPLPDGIELD